MLMILTLPRLSTKPHITAVTVDVQLSRPTLSKSDRKISQHYKIGACKVTRLFQWSGAYLLLAPYTPLLSSMESVLVALHCRTFQEVLCGSALSVSICQKPKSKTPRNFSIWDTHQDTFVTRSLSWFNVEIRAVRWSPHAGGCCTQRR